MKKLASLALAGTLALGLLSGCATTGGEQPTATPGTDKPATTIKVAASPTPHAEILKIAAAVLEKSGITLEIIEYTDYVQPNLVTQSGEVDANYFQHLPYLEGFNTENKTELVSVAAIHYEPYGIYPGKTATLADLKDGAKIAVPNDSTNEARALQLLAAQGLITLKADAGLKATKLDIAENPKNLDIVEMEAAQLPRTLQDVDLAVINGNYAIPAGLKVGTDALATEETDSEAAQTFANIIAVKAGTEESEAVKALVAALQSPEVKAYMEATYEGAVVPMF